MYIESLALKRVLYTVYSTSTINHDSWIMIDRHLQYSTVPVDALAFAELADRWRSWYQKEKNFPMSFYLLPLIILFNVAFLVSNNNIRIPTVSYS